MQEITSLCDKIGSRINNIQEITSDFIKRSTKGLSSFSEVLPSLTSYGPMLPQNKFIEPVSPGSSSPCHSAVNDNVGDTTRRDKGYTLFDIGRMFLDSLSVNEIQKPTPETGPFSCLLLYGLNNARFVNEFITMLRNSHLNPDYKDARIVIFKGRLSFLMEFDSLNSAQKVYNFLRNDFHAKEFIKCRWQVLWVHNKMMDPQYMASFYAVVLKNLPPDCSIETIQKMIEVNCVNASYTHIDHPVFVGHTVCSLIRTLTLEDAEIIALGLNGLMTKIGTIQAGIHPNSSKQHKHTSRDPFKPIKEYKPEPILVQRKSFVMEEKIMQERQPVPDQGAPFSSLNISEPPQQYMNRDNRGMRPEPVAERDQYMNYRNMPYDNNFPPGAGYGRPQREDYNPGYDEFSRFSNNQRMSQRPDVQMPVDGRAIYDPFSEQPRTAQPIRREPPDYQGNVDNEDDVVEIQVKEEWMQSKTRESAHKEVRKEPVPQQKMDMRENRPPIEDTYERQGGYPPYNDPYYGDNPMNRNITRVYDQFGNPVPPTDLDNRSFPRRGITPQLGNVLEQHHSQYHHLPGQGAYPEPLGPRSIVPKVSKITTPHGKYTVVTQVFMADQDGDESYPEPQPPGRPGWNGEQPGNWDFPRRNVKEPLQMGPYNTRYASEYSTQFDDDPSSSSQFSPAVGPMNNIISPHQDPQRFNEMGMGMFPHNRQKPGMPPRLGFDRQSSGEDISPIKREDFNERFRRRPDRMEGYIDPNMPRNYQTEMENRHRNPQGHMYNPDYAPGPLYDPNRPGPGRMPIGHPGMPGPMGNVDRRFNPPFEDRDMIGRGRYPMEEERFPHNDPRDYDYNQKYLNYPQPQLPYNNPSSYPYPHKNVFPPVQDQFPPNFGPFSKESIDSMYHPPGPKTNFPPQRSMNPEYNDNEYGINQHNRGPPGRFRPGMEVEPDTNRQNNRNLEPQFPGQNPPGYTKQEDRYQLNRPPPNQVQSPNLQGEISPFERQQAPKKPEQFVKQESFMQGGPGMSGPQLNRMIPNKTNDSFEPPQIKNPTIYDTKDFGRGFPQEDRNQFIPLNFDPFVNPNNLAHEKQSQLNRQPGIDPFKDLTLPDVTAMRDAMTISPKNFESLYNRSVQMNLHQFSEFNNVPLDNIQDLEASKEPKDIALVVLDTSSEDDSPAEVEPQKVNKIQIGIETSTKRIDPRLSLRQEMMKQAPKITQKDDTGTSPLSNALKPNMESANVKNTVIRAKSDSTETSKPKDDPIQITPRPVKTVAASLAMEQPVVNKNIENQSKPENNAVPIITPQAVKRESSTVSQSEVSIEKLIAEANNVQKASVTIQEPSSAGQVNPSVLTPSTTEAKKKRKSRFSDSLDISQPNLPIQPTHNVPIANINPAPIQNTVEPSIDVKPQEAKAQENVNQKIDFNPEPQISNAQPTHQTEKVQKSSRFSFHDPPQVINASPASSQVTPITAQVVSQAQPTEQKSISNNTTMLPSGPLTQTEPEKSSDKDLSYKEKQNQMLDEFYRQMLREIAAGENENPEETKTMQVESAPVEAGQGLKTLTQSQEKPVESDIKPQPEQEPAKKVKVTKGIQTDEESDTEMQDNEGLNEDQQTDGTIKIKIENPDAKKLIKFRISTSEKKPLETQPNGSLDPASADKNAIIAKPYKPTYPRRSYIVEPRFRLSANGRNPIKDFNFGIQSDPSGNMSPPYGDYSRNFSQRPLHGLKRTQDQYLQENQAAKYNNGYYTGGQNKLNPYRSKQDAYGPKGNLSIEMMNNPLFASQLLMNNSMLGLMSAQAMPGFIDPDSVFAGTFQNQVVISSVEPEVKTKNSKGNQQPAPEEDDQEGMEFEPQGTPPMPPPQPENEEDEDLETWAKKIICDGKDFDSNAVHKAVNQNP